ncbi:hypothetical protein BpHYR1_014246 [Brachionus plicatilis]|uniref:Reverse transcriptase domain-containing protein n=1 Tax=Brachionus plicatilis TaxID=10195 RepID=A0A3M7SBM5_BRAPC|nr:hypothetical protein BpHYR1_014246 [Brachionus plicatilis]
MFHKPTQNENKFLSSFGGKQKTITKDEFLSSLKELKNKASAGLGLGSCLSPTLFSIFFSDVVKKLPDNINKALFADDILIY